MREKQRKLLEELRSTLVGTLHVQPFTIYTDKNIEDLLVAQPKSLDDLKKVKGFPETGKRFKGFGQSIVDIFTKTDSVTSVAVNTNSSGDLVIKAMVKKMEAF